MSEENQSAEVSLIDLVNVFLRYKWVFLVLPLVAAILAASFVFFVLQPAWEGSATLEIGRVGGAAVEPVVNVVTRINLPSFAKGVLNAGLLKPEEINVAQAFIGTLQASQIKGAELIEVKLRAPSPEMAAKLLKASLLNLQKMQNEIMAVTIEKNKKQLRILLEDIQKGINDDDLLRKKLLASHNWNAFDATLTATLLKDKSIDLRELIQKKLTLEEQLSASRTYPAKVVDEIYVSKEPVFPKKSLIIGLAVLLGLFGAMFVAFAHNAFTSKFLQ
jgi:uncharacterized protein involved in exopolysaccharide biosynthesis